MSVYTIYLGVHVSLLFTFLHYDLRFYAGFEKYATNISIRVDLI